MTYSSFYFIIYNKISKKIINNNISYKISIILLSLIKNLTTLKTITKTSGNNNIKNKIFFESIITTIKNKVNTKLIIKCPIL